MPACMNVRRRTGIVIFDIRILPGRPLGVVCSHETSVNFTSLPLSNAVRTKSVTRFRSNILYPACGAVKKREASSHVHAMRVKSVPATLSQYTYGREQRRVAPV